MSDTNQRQLLVDLTGDKGPVDLGGKLKYDEPLPRFHNTVLWGIFRGDHSFSITDIDEDGLLHKCGVRNGDILESVNHGLVEGLDPGKLMDAIRERTVLVLGLKRRNVHAFFYTSFVVILEVTETDSGPHWNFFGFHCWNKTVTSVPYTPIDVKPLLTYKYFGSDDVYIAVTIKQKNYWLAADKEQNLLSFQRARGVQSKFLMLKYNPTSGVCLGKTTIAMFPNTDDGRMCNLAMEAVRDGSIVLSGNSLAEMKRTIVESGFVFYVVQTKGGLFNILSRDNQYLITLQPDIEPPIPTLQRSGSTPASYQEFRIENEDGTMINL